MSTNHASLGAAADERKARLLKLRSLKRKLPDNEESPFEITTPTEKPDVILNNLSGRNYDAASKGPKLGFETRPDLAAKTTLEQQASSVEHEIRKQGQEEQEDKGVDLFKLQPKKPNWDLKRDLDKVLQKLNVRTENAIASLVRERIEGAKNSTKSISSKSTSISHESEEIGIKGFELVEGVKQLERESREMDDKSDGE